MAKRQSHFHPVASIPRRAGDALRHGCFAMVLAVASTMPAIAASPLLPAPLLPALVQPASLEHHVGKIIFAELVTPDLLAAKQFYGGLFGWTFEDVQAGATVYAEASHDGRLVAALIPRKIPPTERRQPAWLTFIAVSDVAAAKTVALQHGAKLLSGPKAIPNVGEEAVFADPQGAVFAILASSSGDPPDVLAEPGEWIWSALITTDPDKGAAFYQALFGYEVVELKSTDGAEHLLLSSDDYARASANTLPSTGPNAHSHWLNFVRVVDATATAEKVVALGGRVLVTPRLDRHGGKIAVVADPLGAPFGLLEWPDAAASGAMK